MQKLIDLITRVFAEADEDGSGCLTYQEFSKSCRKKENIQNFKGLGFETEDFKVLFNRVDKDGSGEVSLSELCDEMIQMKKAMAGMEKRFAFLRKAFGEADADKSGLLSLEEFHAFLSSQKVRDTLTNMRINVDDIDDLWAAVDSDQFRNYDGVSCDDMIAGLVTMKDPSQNRTRGLNFVYQVFKVADVDQGGTLTPDEVKKAFSTKRVKKKIQSLGLEVPDWMGIFSALDFDGDGELSWDELKKGLESKWASSSGT
jgi:Ca2+-binding EF-hand superfamily protein